MSVGGHAESAVQKLDDVTFSMSWAISEATHHEVRHELEEHLYTIEQAREGMRQLVARLGVGA